MAFDVSARGGGGSVGEARMRGLDDVADELSGMRLRSLKAGGDERREEGWLLLL